MWFQMFIITRFLKELSVLADTVLGDMLFQLLIKKCILISNYYLPA